MKQLAISSRKGCSFLSQSNLSSAVTYACNIPAFGKTSMTLCINANCYVTLKTKLKATLYA